MSLSIITFVVLSAAVIALFSNELMSALKWLRHNSVARFIGPLFVISFIVLSFEEGIAFFIYKIRVFSILSAYLLSKFIPASLGGLLLGKIILLILISFMPLIIGNILSRLEFFSKSSVAVKQTSIIFSAILWVIFSQLLAIGF